MLGVVLGFFFAGLRQAHGLRSQPGHGWGSQRAYLRPVSASYLTMTTHCRGQTVHRMIPWSTSV